MSTRCGRFITLEGIEGAGKSTCLGFVRDLLVAAGVEVRETREPGGTALGEKIRELLLDPENKGMAQDTELLLVFAARAEHISRVIVPALEAGRWVLSDRFTDASFAYQGGGRQMDGRRIAQLEQWVQGDLRPDMTLLLDLPPELGLRRAGNRGAPDRFESERVDFFHRVRAAYLDSAKAEPTRFRVIDAECALGQVQQAIAQAVADLLAHA
jgi:dTMP kinase